MHFSYKCYIILYNDLYFERSSPMKLNSSSSRPLYEQLFNTIKEAIGQNTYRPGQQIPNEAELCDIYGVSRITVRRAIQDLVDEGLLERKQGKGTFVARKKVARELVTIEGFSDFSKQLGKKTSKKVLLCEEIKASKKIAEDLQIEVGAPVLKLLRLMYIEEEPFTLDLTHYPIERFPNIQEHIFDYESTYDVLSNIYHVDMKDITTKKTITGIPASSVEAEHLNCEIGEILFNIDKIVYDKYKVPIHLSTFKNLTTVIAYTITT